MSWPSVQFMSAPDVAATVRLDLSDDDVSIARDGFQQGRPTFVGTPESYGVEYSYRDGLQFTLNITGTKASAITFLQKLSVELLRRENWLMFQMGPSTPPVWFHTWRTEPGDLSFDNVYDQTDPSPPPDLWTVTVPLVADAFIYGAREVMPAATINNDPAAATNPCFLALPTIKGDAPAPLQIAADFSADLNQYDVLWSVAPVPDSYTAPIVWQIGGTDGLTIGTDVGSSVSDASFSGGTYRSCSFTITPGMATRLQGTAPAAIPAGRYNVYLRFARSDTSSTFAFKFGYTTLAGVDVTGSPTAVMDRAASASSGHATWVNMGTFSFPQYSNALVVPGLDYAPVWALQAQRLSGSGAARLDAIMLVPVDLRDMGDAARSLVSMFHGFGPQASDLASYWDGDLESFTRVNGFAVADSSIQPGGMWGGFPQVYPGVQNVMHLLQQTRLATGFFGSTNNSDSISTSAVVTGSYYPRYLYLRAD